MRIGQGGVLVERRLVGILAGLSAAGPQGSLLPKTVSVPLCPLIGRPLVFNYAQNKWSQHCRSPPKENSEDFSLHRPLCKDMMGGSPMADQRSTVRGCPMRFWGFWPKKAGTVRYPKKSRRTSSRQLVVELLEARV